MTNDIDEAARVVAEKLLRLAFLSDGTPFIYEPTGANKPLSWLRTYEGMGVVLEALRAEGWRISIGLVEHVDEGRSTIWEGWNASFYRTGVGYGMKNPMPEADADSLADAVLLAASVAVREAKDE